MKLIPGLLSESLFGILFIRPSTNNCHYALKLHHVLASKFPHSYPFFPLVFSGENTADEGDRVGRSIQMSIWLLGNLAYSGFVTS